MCQHVNCQHVVLTAPRLTESVTIMFPGAHCWAHLTVDCPLVCLALVTVWLGNYDRPRHLTPDTEDWRTRHSVLWLTGPLRLATCRDHAGLSWYAGWGNDNVLKTYHHNSIEELDIIVIVNTNWSHLYTSILGPYKLNFLKSFFCLALLAKEILHIFLLYLQLELGFDDWDYGSDLGLTTL